MSILKRHYYYLILLPLCLLIISVSGCGPSNARVFYDGTKSLKKVSVATLTIETSQELIDGGYEQIGIIQSEPTTRGLSVSKQAFEQNPQAVMDSIAPENTYSLSGYYLSLDKEVCREAARVGGEKVRLEEIKHNYTFPFPEDVASKMKEAMADDLTVRFVTSIKYWSIWKRSN